MTDTIKTKTIAQILDPESFDDGQAVSRVTGVITTIFDPKKGEDYEYQSAKLKDDTGEIEISFSKCSQPKSAKGQPVTFTSVKTAHGVQGVKVADSTYTSKKTNETVSKRILKITPTCEIVYEGGALAQPASTPAPAGKAQSSQPQPQGSRFQTDMLNDLADLQLSCFLQTITKIGAAIEKEGMVVSDHMDNVCSMATSLFIQSERAGLANMWRAGAVKAVTYPPTPKDPSQWRECYVPKGKLQGKTLAEVPDADLLALFSYYDGKKDNGAFAENVYRAAHDRGILPKSEPKSDPDPVDSDDDSDEIPF